MKKTLLIAGALTATLAVAALASGPANAKIDASPSFDAPRTAIKAQQKLNSTTIARVTNCYCTFWNPRTGQCFSFRCY